MGVGQIFSFEGRIGRVPFALSALAALVIQQIAFTLLVGDYWFSPGHLMYPWIAPLHDLWNGIDGPSHRWTGIVAGVPIGLIMLCLWRLTAICFRRARTTAAAPGFAALALVPYLQLVVCAMLLVSAERPLAAPDSLTVKRERHWQVRLTGIYAGVGIAVLGTLVSTLILGTYGLGLFAGVPLIMGFAVAYGANRDGDIGLHRTFSATAASLLLAGAALTGFAIEGAICVALAFPLALGMAMGGAVIGRGWVLRRNYRRGTMRSVWLLPLLLSVELLAPPHAQFESSESIEIAATQMQVWDAVVHMGPIPDRPVAPFSWGLAYPQRGVIRGSGVGAVREGVFSTGVAYERVTVWEPGRRLFFDVLSDPPMMQELSPFAHITAPHTVGYFKTRDARFTITPLANGHSRLTLITMHELDIGPMPYFRPITEWAIHANKRRVLNHFRAQAESASHAH